MACHSSMRKEVSSSLLGGGGGALQWLVLTLLAKPKGELCGNHKVMAGGGLPVMEKVEGWSMSG